MKALLVSRGGTKKMTAAVAATAAVRIRAFKWPRRNSASQRDPLTNTPATAPAPTTTSSRFASTWLMWYWPVTNSVPKVCTPARK